MQADPTNLPPVQASLAAVDSAWEKVNCLAMERDRVLSVAVSLWKECSELKDQLSNIIEDAKSSAGLNAKLTPVIFGDAMQVQNQIEKCKVRYTVKY